MSFMKSLYGVANNLLAKDVFVFLDLDCPITSTSIKTKHNSLVSVVRLDGFYKLRGLAELKESTLAFAELIKSTFNGPGHSLQIVGDFDEAHTEVEARNNYEPINATCSRLGIDFSDIHEEQVQIIKEFCRYEGVFIALWTHTSVLDADVRKKEYEDVNSKRLKFYDLFQNAPNPFYLDSLLTHHESFVETTVAALTEASYRLKLLDAHEVGAQIKFQVEQNICDADFSPILFGDKVSSVKTIDASHQSVPASHFLPPKLDTQLATGHQNFVEKGIIEVGGLYYGSLLVSTYPRKSANFNQFLNRLTSAKIRFRISYHFNHGMGAEVTVTSVLNTFVKMLHSDNALFKDAFDSEWNVDDTGQKTEISMQVALVVKADTIEKLKKDIASAIKFYQQTYEGNMIVDVVDAGETHITSCIGTMPKTSVMCGYPPPVDAAYMLPLMRPASFWQQGGIVFRTVEGRGRKEGKPWYWQPGSGIQQSQMDLILARPRQGKSVLSNAIQKAFCTKAGITNLPYCVTFDVGKASFGFVELLKDSLQEDQKHLAIAHTIVYDDRSPMNPLDIQFGLKKPLPNEQADMLTFMLLLLSEPGESNVKEGLSDCVSAVIEQAFRQFADPMTAKKYSKYVNAEIDELINSSSAFDTIRNDIQGYSWFEIRDILFTAGHVLEANRAHLLAMPTPDDLTLVAEESESLRKSYGDECGFTYNVVKFFVNKMNSVLREFPIYRKTTAVDFANARVMAIDLAPGVGDQSPTGSKKTSLTFLSVRYHATRHLYLKLDDDLPAFPPLYRAYQEKRIRDINETEKRVTYDEFHMYSKTRQPVEQVERDQRVAGKANMSIAVITHVIEDLSDSIIQNCTNKFILGSVTNTDVKSFESKIGLSESEKKLLTTQGNMHGPVKGGSSLLYIFDINDGRYSQFLKFAVGPIELWSYNTTNQDGIIRKEVSRVFGRDKAKRFLAQRYPSGTAVGEIDRRMNLRGMSDSADVDEENVKIAYVLAQEIIDEQLKNGEKDA